MKSVLSGWGIAALVLVVVTCLARAQDQDIAEDFRENARRAAPRDAFPVFDQPAMADAAEADRALRPDDWVIGVVLGGNDTCGGVPIAVSW
jgi:hypothetical protein